jgi:translation initiation factor 4E
MWEDEDNKNGGRWHIWLPKGYSNRLWEDLLLAVVGDQFVFGENICGVEVRTKVRGDTISVWHKNADDEEERMQIKKDFLSAINAPEGINVEYENFAESIANDHSAGQSKYPSYADNKGGPSNQNKKFKGKKEGGFAKRGGRGMMNKS